MFKLKQKITGKAVNNGTKDVKIMLPLKYLSNFWRTLEIPLTNCEFNLILTWSANSVISNAATNQAKTYAITDTKLYVLIVTLSTNDNGKLLLLKSGFKRTINWNKYQLKTTTQNAPSQYLDYLIEPSFQGVNRYYVPTEKVEDYNVMIDGKNFFDQTIKNDIKIYENIRKITTGQEDDYTAGFLLDYNYFVKHYKMITTDLGK